MAISRMSPTLPNPLLLLLALAAFHGRMIRAQSGGDLTLMPGAKGGGVVETTCDLITARCVFVEDKMLTRRVAFTESGDGNDNDTFRDGYFGGIWQASNRRRLSLKRVESVCILSDAS